MLTVTTPAESFDLVSLIVAKAEFGVGSNNADIAKLTANISQASAAIASHCNRVFGLEVLTEVFRLERSSSELLLTRFPVTEILSIVTPDGQTITSDQFEFEPTGALRFLANDCPSRWSNGKTTVAYTAGYELPDNAPDDLVRAAIILIRYYRSGPAPLVRGVDITGISSKTFSDYPADLAFPPEVHALVSHYRVPMTGCSSCP